jgi:hypothetical protein
MRQKHQPSAATCLLPNSVRGTAIITVWAYPGSERRPWGDCRLWSWLGSAWRRATAQRPAQASPLCSSVKAGARPQVWNHNDGSTPSSAALMPPLPLPRYIHGHASAGAGVPVWVATIDPVGWCALQPSCAFKAGARGEKAGGEELDDRRSLLRVGTMGCRAGAGRLPPGCRQAGGSCCAAGGQPRHSRVGRWQQRRRCAPAAAG